MKYFLLLGAGFSRNWGGWLASEAFEYLLGCNEIRRSEYLKELLWKHQKGEGFEAALAELQEAWAQELQEKQTSAPYHSHIFDHMRDLLTALDNMFRDMNSAFDKLYKLEFQTMEIIVSDFLKRFDAIYTLNQDLLFEKKYKFGSLIKDINPKWEEWHLPGMREAKYSSGYDKETSKWIPEKEHQFKLKERSQPYYKLHGSSNWRDGGDRDLLVMGSNKNRTISSHDILKWYYQQFCDDLSIQEPARLMVIGYSFRDDHINKAIVDAVQKGLEIFIIDPIGTEVLEHCNLIKLHNAVIGASRRSFRDTFIDKVNVEYHKVMRFFN